MMPVKKSTRKLNYLTNVLFSNHLNVRINLVPLLKTIVINVSKLLMVKNK
jgi:hypothetical protein